MAEDWGDTFNAAYQRSSDQWKVQQNLDRQYKLQKELHDQQMREAKVRAQALEEAQGRERGYYTDVADITDNQTLGIRDPRATAAAQATAGMQAIDYNSPSGVYDAAPAAPVVRGAKVGLADTTRGLAVAGLKAGKINAAQYGEAQDKAKGYQFSDDIKAGGAEYDALTPEARATWWKMQSYDNAIPAYGNYVKDKKSGYVEFSPEGKPSVKLTAAEERMMYAASKAAENDPERAIAILQSGTNTMRSLAKDMLAAQHSGAVANNQGLHFQRADANDAARLGIARETLEQGKNQIVGTKTGHKFDEAGNIIPVITGLKLNVKTGKYEAVDMPMEGTGYIPESAMNPKVVQTYVEGLVGKPTGKLANGKPQVYDESTATQEYWNQLRQRLAPTPSRTGGVGSDPYSAQSAPGTRPAVGLIVPGDAEKKRAAAIQAMDDPTFAAYQRMISNQPTSPLDRQLLRKAGVAP